MSKQTLDRVYMVPLYTKGEVASIVAAPASTVHSWLVGRAADRRFYPPVIEGVGKGRAHRCPSPDWLRHTCSTHFGRPAFHFSAFARPF
ncbi:hypothetical protein GCM10028798_12430 [Humibacter antri]